jgi:hypothetical protein
MESTRVEVDDSAAGEGGSGWSAYEGGGPAFFARRVTFVDKVV